MHGRLVADDAGYGVTGGIPDVVGGRLPAGAGANEVVDQELMGAVMPIAQTDEFPRQTLDRMDG